MASKGAPGQARRYGAIDVIFWMSATWVIVLFVSLTVGWNDHSLVLGIVSFLVMAYVVFTAYRAALAQARIDGAEIKNAHALIRQCRTTVGRMEKALMEEDFDRVYVLLGQLHGRVGLFLTKYGRYMRPESADIVWDMENSIAAAGFLQETELLQFMTMVRDHLGSMKDNILDVNDRTLRAIGNKIG